MGRSRMERSRHRRLRKYRRKHSNRVAHHALSGRRAAGLSRDFKLLAIAAHPGPPRILEVMKKIHIIGGGLAGPEAALQAASAGCDVTLFEMRPNRSTEAHQTSDFAELVCSNAPKPEAENSPPWLLKQEMRRAGSFLLKAADESAVPAGHALAVDRKVFSQKVAAQIENNPRITVVREEVTALDEHNAGTITILAS